MNVVEFLRFLYSYSRVLSLRELAFLTTLSDRTIRTIIAEANEQMDELGCHIDLIRAIGYQLIIDDKDIFCKCVLLEKNQSLKTIEFDVLCELYQTDYIKIDELCSRYYVSNGTINKTIKQLKEKLSQYNLQILSKPYLGLYLAGDEYEKRKLLVDVGVYNNSNKVYKEIIKRVFMERSVYYNDNILNYLEKYLELITKRQDQSEELVCIDNEQLSNKAIEVTKEIFNADPVLRTLPVKEMSYFANILTMMVILPEDGLKTTILSQMEIFNQRIYDKYRIDLTKNKILYKQFLRHLLYLHKRITSYYQYMNIGFEYYHITSSLGYELAIELTDYMFPGAKLYDEEIGMVALYFGLFLQSNQIRYYNKNKKMAIVVPRYDLSSELFISIFKHNQGKERIEIFTVNDIEDIREYNPDIIFTFESFHLDSYEVFVIPLPIFQICDNGFIKNTPVFMNQESYLKYKQHYELLAGIKLYFSSEHFLSHQKIKTLTQMIQLLSSHIETHELLDNAKECLVKRIEKAPIAKNGSIAVICPDSYAKESKIIFTSFKEPFSIPHQSSIHMALVILYKNDIDKRDMLLMMGALFDTLEHTIDIYEQENYQSFIQYLENR